MDWSENLNLMTVLNSSESCSKSIEKLTKQLRRNTKNRMLEGLTKKRRMRRSSKQLLQATKRHKQSSC